MPGVSWRVGVDVGGTFTDLVATDAAGAILRFKVATTPRAPEEGLLDAVRTLLRDEVRDILEQTLAIESAHLHVHAVARVAAIAPFHWQ